MTFGWIAVNPTTNSSGISDDDYKEALQYVPASYRYMFNQK
jgi:hypothetical protein